MSKTQALREHVLECLRTINAKRLCIAVSGGLDSTVLLHLLSSMRSELKVPIYAVHINHQLSPHAEQWQDQVLTQCHVLQVPCQTHRVRVSTEQGLGLEAAARQARYQAIITNMQQGDVLLTAHHADDQIETMLHHLCRGSGLKGLTAMQVQSKKQGYDHLRPLLTVGRAELLTYAQHNQLQWVEDESNQQTHLSRNFIRQQVLPLLESHYPGARANLLRSNRLLQASAEQLSASVIEAYQSCLHPQKQGLLISKLSEYTIAQQNEIIRYWLQQQELPYPHEKHMQHLHTCVLQARTDAMPRLDIQHYSFRRYQGVLYTTPRDFPETKSLAVHWAKGRQQCVLPHNLGVLRAAQPLSEDSVVRFQQWGAVIRPEYSRCHQKVKKIFQQAAVPPWLRRCWPMLYSESGELLALPGLVSGEVTWQKGHILS